MQEVFRSQSEHIDERPIGRFLFALDDYEIVSHEDGFRFAKDFADEYGQLLHKEKVSFVARAQLNPDNTVSIPPNTPQYEDAVWLEFDNRKPYRDERYIWRVSGGVEQYDLEVREGYWLCTYIEKTRQGAVLRRYPIHDEQQIRGVHELVRSIVQNTSFDERVEQMKRQIAADESELERLAVSTERPTVKRGKRMSALRSALFNAGFHAGWADKSHVVPLLHGNDDYEQ